MPKENPKDEVVVIIDTNVLLEDGDAPMRLKGVASVVMPSVVIDELDDNKERKDASGANARLAAKMLDRYTEKASKENIDLHRDGIPLGKRKPRLFIYQECQLHPKVSDLYKKEIPDNFVISVALRMKEQADREIERAEKSDEKIPRKKVVLISNDINVRNKARLLGVPAEKYINSSVRGIDSIYSGVVNVPLSDELLAELHENGSIPYEKVKRQLGKKAPKPYSYEFFVSDKIRSFFFEDHLHLITDNECTRIYECIKAKNVEQKLAMSVLLNPNVEVVTISGIAGSGKTLLAIGAGFQQMEHFPKFILTRPIVGLNGQELGTLPGDAKEKVDPYMKPIYDNIDFIIENLRKNGSEKALNRVQELIHDKERFVVEALQLIRGRTFANAWIVVDEAQNLSFDDARAIMTRIGKGSKIILVGDLSQTDYHWMNVTNNGLSYLIHNLKNYEKAAHITLVKGERSELSEWAGKNL